MADISSCGPIIDRKYPQLKSAYVSLCIKLRELGGNEISDPMTKSKIIETRFTDDERKVLRILSMEVIIRHIR